MEKGLKLIFAVCVGLILGVAFYSTYQIGKHHGVRDASTVFHVGWLKGSMAGRECKNYEEMQIRWVHDSLDFTEYATFDTTHPAE